jgi:hypothetical protein
MTNQKTEKLVIVIGAGASADFRRKEKDDKLEIAMPTGEELVRIIGNPKEIANLINYKNEARSATYSIRVGGKEYDLTSLLSPEIGQIRNILLKEYRADPFLAFIALSQLVSYYQPFSIDELLDSIEKEKINIRVNNAASSKEELIKAGKELIAYFLLKAENEKVFEDFESICWYRHLRNMIITSGANDEEIKKNLENLTIISFNYDRSLEYFLQTRLGEFYKDIKPRIVYPYGYLAEEHGTEDYGKITEKDLFKKAQEMAKELKTIGEAIGNEEGIKEAIKEAEKIYFLGFGFHEQNCHLLANKGVIQQSTETNRGTVSKKFYYTNFGGSKKTEEKFVALTSSNFDSTNPTADKVFYHQQCKTSDKGVYEALREDFDLRFS